MHTSLVLNAGLQGAKGTTGLKLCSTPAALLGTKAVHMTSRKLSVELQTLLWYKGESPEDSQVRCSLPSDLSAVVARAAISLLGK